MKITVRKFISFFFVLEIRLFLSVHKVFSCSAHVTSPDMQASMYNATV